MGSVQQEDIFADWQFFSHMLVEQVMHDIVENMDENEFDFDLEYLFLAARRLRANHLSHFSPRQQMDGKIREKLLD